MNLLLKDTLTLTNSPEQIQNINFIGKWENELGSTMEITRNMNGLLEGTYTTAVGQPPNMETFKLTGFASGDLISFVVDFGKYGSITSWTGQHSLKEGSEIIFTMWHMAINLKDEEEDKKIWGSVWTGYNNFKRS